MKLYSKRNLTKLKIHSFLTFHIIKKVKIFISGDDISIDVIFFQHLPRFVKKAILIFNTFSTFSKKLTMEINLIHNVSLLTGPLSRDFHPLVTSSKSSSVENGILSNFMRFHSPRSKDFPEMHS